MRKLKYLLTVGVITSLLGFNTLHAETLEEVLKIYEDTILSLMEEQEKTQSKVNELELAIKKINSPKETEKISVDSKYLGEFNAYIKKHSK